MRRGAMAGNQLTVLMRLNSQSGSGFRKGVSIVKGLRLVATAALALPLMCSGLMFSWTLTKKALAQTSAAQGRSGAVSKGEEAPQTAPWSARIFSALVSFIR